MQEEFSKIILTEIERLRKADGLIVPESQPVANGDLDNLLQDLDDEEEIRTISKTVAAYNQQRPTRDAIRDMYAGVETYRLDSNI